MHQHINGIDIGYELSGNVSGPTVMLSHSLSCDRHVWDYQLPALQPTFRVLRYDSRGHGASGAPAGPYSLDQLGDDAVGLLDALGLSRVHFVGVSMGGMVGQNLALRYPERLLSLTLSDTTAEIPADEQPDWQQRIDTATAEGMGALVQETLAICFSERFRHDPSASAALEQTERAILTTPVSGFVGCCEAIRQLDYLSALERIRVPTLVTVGEHDPDTPPARARAIQQRIKNARLVMIPDAAHLNNIEQAPLYNRALLNFIG